MILPAMDAVFLVQFRCKSSNWAGTDITTLFTGTISFRSVALWSVPTIIDPTSSGDAYHSVLFTFTTQPIIPYSSLLQAEGNKTMQQHFQFIATYSLKSMKANILLGRKICIHVWLSARRSSLPLSFHTVCGAVSM